MIRAKAAIWTAALLVLLAGLTGCGIRPSGVITGVDAPSGPVEDDGLALYLLKDGAPVAVPRLLAPANVDLVELLAAGPSDAERAAGLTTAVPTEAAPAVVVRTVDRLDVTIGVDLDTLTGSAITQITCTLLANSPGVVVVLRGGGQRHDASFCRP